MSSLSYAYCKAYLVKLVRNSRFHWKRCIGKRRGVSGKERYFTIHCCSFVEELAEILKVKYRVRKNKQNKNGLTKEMSKYEDSGLGLGQKVTHKTWSKKIIY